MTQWSDGAGPPAYGSSPAAGYGAPGGAPYGSPYGPGSRPQRETGALVVCVVLLVLALVGCLVASAAVHADLTKHSDAGPGITVPTYGVQGGGAAGGGTGAAAPSPTATDPDAIRHRIERAFPRYPGSRQVSKPKKFLGGAKITAGHGARYFFVTSSVNAVYHWYQRHLRRDHLHFGTQYRTFYSGTHRLAYLFGSVEFPQGSLGEGTAEFDLQQGRRSGTCVVTVNFYD